MMMREPVDPAVIPPPNGTEPNTILEVKDLKSYFPIRQGLFQKVVANVKAVDGVSFSIRRRRSTRAGRRKRLRQNNRRADNLAPV